MRSPFRSAEVPKARAEDPGTSDRRSRGRRILLATLALAVGSFLSLLLLFAVDRLLGMATSASESPQTQPAGLIYPPRTEIRHDAAEFSYVARINSLGFRGEEPRRDSTLRIAAFGDSFVYGWGVDDPFTWPEQLERLVSAELGRPVEVLNLGMSGASPSTYASVAERALPLLDPDAVLFVITQGQDFAQLWWESQTLSERVRTLSAREIPGTVWAKLRIRAARYLPILLAQRAQPRPGPPPRDEPADSAAASAVLAGTAAQARHIERMLGGEHRQRFESLDPEVRRLFREGRLNPAMLYYSLREPRYFLLTRELGTARGRDVTRRLTASITRVRAAARGAPVLVIVLPYGPYVSAAMCESVRRQGYLCEESLQQSAAADEAVMRAAQRADVGALSVTDGFREAVRTSATPLFFPLDGHYTTAGYRLFAELTAPRVTALLRPRADSAEAK